MIKKVNSSVVSKEKFWKIYQSGNVIGTSLKRAGKAHSSTFQFSNKRIAALPFCEEVVDLYHLGEITDTDSNKIEGVTLVLRITKTRKSFYFRYKNKMSPKLGHWFENETNRSTFTGDNINFAEAKRRAAENANHLKVRNASVAHIADWTFAEYIDKQYKSDRDIHPLQNNKKKEVSDDVRKKIKSDLGEKVNDKLRNVQLSWLDDLEEYWKKDKLNPANGIVGHKSINSQRKAYTQINAMLNICVKAGYIVKNPFAGEAYRYENNVDEEREINTIDISPDTALKFIFESAPGSMQGKILLASMMMGGFRNSEVYRNYTSNFRVNKREVFVPASISHKSKKSRTVPIENDYYWSKVEEYLKSPEYLSNKNTAGHFLPMKRRPSEKTRERLGDLPAHATDAVKKPVWTAFKKQFSLSKEVRAYDFRHTFITNAAECMHLHEVIKYSGNSVEMVSKHYAKVDKEKARPHFAGFQSDNNETTCETFNSPSLQASVTADIVIVRDSDIPPNLKKYWGLFRAGKVNNTGQIKRDDFKKFVNIIQRLFDAGDISGEESELWLMMQ